MIVYSDALTVDKALALKKQCDEVGFTGTWSSDPKLSLRVVTLEICSVLRDRDFTLE
jgi:hypothetical protein